MNNHPTKKELQRRKAETNMNLAKMRELYQVPIQWGQTVSNGHTTGKIVGCYETSYLLIKWDGKRRASKFKYNPLILRYWQYGEFVNFEEVK